MKKFIAIVLCLFMTACFQTYNPTRDDAAGLLKNDEFMRHANKNYVSNEKTIALISGVSNSLMFAPFYVFSNFENKTNGLGYSKHYEYGGNVMATVFAYHMRIDAANMPTNIHADAFDRIYQTEVSNLKKSEGELYKNIRVQSQDFANIKGMDKSIEFKKFAYRADDMRNDNLDVISIMYLTVYNGAILKVRINYPSADRQTGEKFEKLFMQELVVNLADFNGDAAAFEDARAIAISRMENDPEQ